MSSASDVGDGAIPKLPLWDTICRSYSTYFHNFRDVLLICWLWIIVVAPLMALEHALQWSWMARVMADLKQGTSPQTTALRVSMPLELRALIYGFVLLVSLAGASIAVAWHRRIILGERPRLSGSNIASGSFWRYVGVAIAIFLIAFVPLLFGGLTSIVFLAIFVSHGAPGSHNSGAALLDILFMFFLYLTGITVIIRLCLLFSARAVGDLGATFTQAWNRTRGNTWRIIWGILACTVPPGLIIEVPFLILFGFQGLKNFSGGSPPVPVLATSVLMACYLLMLPIWIGFLSLSYLHFLGRRPD